MENKSVLEMIDEDGNVLKYDVILAFKWEKNNKNYIVYTDNEIGSDGNLNLYASIYDPFDETKIFNVETEEEWKEIEYRYNILFNNRGDLNE